jgi:hypothetical protein
MDEIVVLICDAGRPGEMDLSVFWKRMSSFPLSNRCDSGMMLPASS